MAQEFCPEVKPGKKNATLFGCILLAGHKGPHINGRNEGWVSRCGVKLYDQDDGEESHCRLKKGHDGKHDDGRYPERPAQRQEDLKWLLKN